MNKNPLTRVGTLVGFVLILLWCLLPVAWIISLSFKSQEAVTNGSPGFLPGDAWTGLDNYGRCCRTTTSCSPSATRSSCR
ncbi:MAG: hypothetical protein PGN15_13375 [Aeromicrobium erythreum]